MASHEFRTPLSAILSSISLVETYRGQEQEQKRAKHIERIKSSVRNLTDILNDFLSLDKLEQGKVVAERTPFDLRDFLKEIREEMEGIIRKKSQQIKFSYSGDTDIYQDKKILRNVLLNLLSNASKYSEDEKDVYLTADVYDDAISISVKDNGIGIPEEDQKHLFSKFFRAKNTDAIQGTGLGLSIVKHYVELMNGAISFTSRQHEGTTFNVRIPRTINNGNHTAH
jgi:signal transduction histidine kinase